MRKHTQILFVFVAALLFGCSSEKETVTVNGSFSPSEIIMMVNSLPSAIQTFSAAGSLYIETPQMSQSAGFELAVKKPDSVRITIEGPFGIMMGRALFTQHHFIAYSALNNTLYQGDPQKGMKSLPFFSGIESGVLIDALSGVRRFNDMLGEPDSFSVTSNTYLFHFTNGMHIVKISVDAESMRISKVKTYSTEGALLWEEFYTYVQSKEGLWQPETSKIVVPERSMSIEFLFDEVLINAPLSSLSIAFPDDAEQISIH